MMSERRQSLAALLRKRPASRPIAALLLSFLVAVLSISPLSISRLFGQTAPPAQSPPAPPEQAPGISTNVNEVSLDLAVHDKKHNAVPDLKPEDLVVTDNGIPVKLTGFHLVSGDAATERGHAVTLMFDPFHGAV